LKNGIGGISSSTLPHGGVAMDKETNRIVLEQISFHLLEAMRFCNQLDLSGLPHSEQGLWNDRIKFCKNALDFTKETVQRLSEIVSP